MAQGLSDLGDFRSIRLRAVSPSGMDLYDLEFRNGMATAGLFLEPDSRISDLSLERR